MERDLTSGSVFKTVVYFSLPYLLSYFLQTLYGMADLFIVGQFGGVSSTTAVSIGSQIMHMLTVMIVGLAMGSTVMIGRSIGAKNKRQAAECIGNTVTMFMGISMVLMAVLLVLVRPIVGIMSTPAEAMKHLSSIGTVVYLQVSYEELENRLGGLHERGVVMKNGIGMSLADLYEERVPLYEKYADLTIDINGLSVRDAARKLVDQISML